VSHSHTKPAASASTAGPCPGRRSRKRQAILTAARALFCAEGYAATSVDAIAALAEVSKATVYAHFPSKNELLTEVLLSMAEGYLPVSDALLDRPVDEGLRWLADRLVGLITSPEGLTIYRVILTQAPDFPEMVKAWHPGGPRHAIGAVTRYLEEQDRRGRLRVADPDLAARVFLHAVKGDIQAAALFGAPLEAERRGRIVDEVVRVMLAAYAPDRPTR
jgi:AcrR family transcriptional regulator